MKKYIQESSDKMKAEYKEYYLYDKPVYVIKDLSKEINLEKALKTIEYRLPQYFTNNFENIYVGDFSKFADTANINAMYKDGTIYVSNIQDNEEDMIDDIVHEIAHSLEKNNYEEIYGDGMLEKEFLAKRKYLYHMLPSEDRVNMVYFLNPSYDKKFDMYLYKDVGYDALRSLTSELFYSPYAITALKEYWANGFEHYFLSDRLKLKDISPILYNKIKDLISLKREKYNEI